MNSVCIFPELAGICSKGDDLARIRSAATDAINKWDSDLTIFTDGSAVEGFKQGGAAAVVKIDDDPHGRKRPWLKAPHSPAPLKRSVKR